MATIVFGATAGNWSDNTKWVGGVKPTAAGDAQLTSTSAACTIDVDSVCRSLDCTGYTGTLAHTAAKTLTIGDGTAGAGSVALKLVAGMTYTLGATTSAIAFVSTSPTQQTITAAGKTLGNLTFSGANTRSYRLADALTANNITVSPGTLFTLPSSTTTTINGTLTATGTPYGYLYLPGVAGNYASTPDTAALSITGDIDIRCKVALVDWTTGTYNNFLAKRSGTSAGAYCFQMTSGILHFVHLVGSTSTDRAATASINPGAGVTAWVRMTWRQSDGRIQFFTAPGSLSNPVIADWAQVGTNVTGTTAAMTDTVNVLEVGSQYTGTSAPMLGKFYRAQIRNNVLDDGSGIVFDADFTTKPFGANTFTESSANAATVTINGALAQAGDGRIALVSSTPGTPATLTSPNQQSNDYLAVKDSTAAGAGKWYAGSHSVNVSGNTGWNFTGPPSGNFFAFF